MKNTTLCYLERDGKYLMLCRNKHKKNDCNDGKWIGVGGHFEENESPAECVCREVSEETGLRLRHGKLRGIVTFVSDRWETEQMFLFTSDDFDGELRECDEGTLSWIDKKDVMGLNLWEGDRIFLKMLEDGEPFFLLKLEYEGDRLTGWRLE